jgi:hypothetical protein
MRALAILLTSMLAVACGGAEAASHAASDGGTRPLARAEPAFGKKRTGSEPPPRIEGASRSRCFSHGEACGVGPMS